MGRLEILGSTLRRRERQLCFYSRNCCDSSFQGSKKSFQWRLPLFFPSLSLSLSAEPFSCPPTLCCSKHIRPSFTSLWSPKQNAGSCSFFCDSTHVARVTLSSRNSLLLMSDWLITNVLSIERRWRWQLRRRCGARGGGGGARRGVAKVTVVAVAVKRKPESKLPDRGK